MSETSYVSLSLATALERSLDTAAHNLANVSTAGFKTVLPIFESHESESTGETINYVFDKGDYIDTRQGSMIATSNPLDIAVSGSGWLGYETPSGQTAYGRDGRLAISNEGRLVTMSGAAILDNGGSPIDVPAGAASGLTIASDGTISDLDGNVLGQIGVFEVSDPIDLQAIGNGLFLPGSQGSSPEPSQGAEIKQGYIEQSNVQPIMEMTRLIEIQRAYERANSLISNDSELTQRVIQRLGRAV